MHVPLTVAYSTSPFCHLSAHTIFAYADAFVRSALQPFKVFTGPACMSAAIDMCPGLYAVNSRWDTASVAFLNVSIVDHDLTCTI